VREEGKTGGPGVFGLGLVRFRQGRRLDSGGHSRAAIPLLGKVAATRRGLEERRISYAAGRDAWPIVGTTRQTYGARGEPSIQRWRILGDFARASRAEGSREQIVPAGNNLRPPQSGERPNGRRARWRVAKRPEAAPEPEV